jgi:predicted nucleic acid-binding protein
MAREKKSKPTLKVVFETSALYTKISYDLIKNEVRKLIEANSKHNDLNIEWYMPSVVIGEREYQMQRGAYDLLPSVSTLEKLLGNSLNINKKILDRQIEDAIKTQLSELNISILNIDISKVDWNELINRSVYRQLPFEIEKEKGFRDSLIAETFIQLVHNSPVTPSVCRLAIMTADRLLTAYIKEKTAEVKNVRILSTVSELESLINTLVSQVTEEFVSVIKEKVDNFFFENKENKACLYYREGIRKKITEQFSSELNSTPREELIRENGTWFIGKPVFIKKTKQRTYWVTQIKVEAKLSKYEYSGQNISATGLLSGSGTSGTSDSLATGRLSSIWNELYHSEAPSKVKIPPDKISEILNRPIESLTMRLPALTQATKKVDVTTGYSLYEIHWSVNITQTKKLTKPKIENIQFIVTKWNEED